MNETQRIDAFEATQAEFVLACIDWARAVLTGADASEARKRRDGLRAGGVLARLGAAFALSPAEEDVLCLTLAHRVDGTISTLAAEAMGDPRHGYISAHLITRCLAGDNPGFATALMQHLHPDAPLRHWALVTLRDTHALAAIELTEGAALRLMGVPIPWPSFCSVIDASVTLPRFAELAAQADPYLPGGIALIGPARSGRRLVAAEIARARQGYALAIDPLQAAEDGDLRARFRGLARDLRLDGTVVVLDTAPDADMPHPEDPSEPRPSRRTPPQLARLAAEVLGDAFIALAREPGTLPPGLQRLRVVPPSQAERAALWAMALPPDHPRARLRAVAAQFPLGPSEIAEIARALPVDAPPDALWQQCRDRGGRGIDALADRIVPRQGWDDLVLPPHVLADLRALADQVRHRVRVLEDWGFADRLPSGQGVTALLAGPSGVGKTMAAEVIAGDLGLDLYKVDLSRLISKYIGETEKNLRRVFDAAEQTGACLFLDEADACLGKRSEVKDSHDRHANIEVSYLLQRMESYSGLCVMATNLKNNLDGAFLRRLRFVIDLPFPDQGMRRRIWQGAFPPGTPTEALDWRALSRLDVSGGSIMVIAVNAAFLAAAEDGPVTMARIARAAQGEYRKHDRSFRPEW